MKSPAVQGASSGMDSKTGWGAGTTQRLMATPKNRWRAWPTTISRNQAQLQRHVRLPHTSRPSNRCARAPQSLHTQAQVLQQRRARPTALAKHRHRNRGGVPHSPSRYTQQQRRARSTTLPQQQRRAWATTLSLSRIHTARQGRRATTAPSHTRTGKGRPTWMLFSSPERGSCTRGG